MKALIGAIVLSLLVIPLAASAEDATADALPLQPEASVPSLEQQLAPPSSTPADELVPETEAKIFLASRCTTSTTCNTSVVCILPGGGEGALGVTKRTCCPICQFPPCEIQQCHTDVIAVFCGCS